MTNEAQNMSQPAQPQAQKKSRTGRGVCLILLPFAILFLSLFSYAIVSFLNSQESISQSTAHLLQIITSIGGLVGLVGIWVFIPLGIYYLRKKD